MQNSKPRVHGLDTLRSLAIVSVIVFHVLSYGGADKLPAWLLPIAHFGWMGVDLFFVLSGYLIGSQLLRPYLAGGLWDFYRNRMYRILPAYLAVLALYEFVPAWREEPTLAPVWSFLTFTLNFVMGPTGAYGFSQAWSLCVEEHFYLLLPLIVLIMMRRASLRKTVAVVAGLVLLGMGIRSFILFHWLRPLADTAQGFGMTFLNLVYYATYSHFDGLLVGVVLAVVKTFRPAWWAAFARRGHLQSAAGCGLLAVSILLLANRYESVNGISAVGDVIGFPVLSLGLGLLVASALSENGVLSRYRVPGAEWIATLAYSLYLTQKEMIHLVSEWFPFAARWGSCGWLAVYAACCLFVAEALYLCVERPFLMLRDRQRTTQTMALAAK